MALGLASLPLSLLACGPAPCGPGPEVCDTLLHHPDLMDDDHDWLFDPTRVARIDLALDADAVSVLSAERLFARPRREVRGDVTCSSTGTTRA